MASDPSPERGQDGGPNPYARKSVWPGLPPAAMSLDPRLAVGRRGAPAFTHVDKRSAPPMLRAGSSSLFSGSATPLPFRTLPPGAVIGRGAPLPPPPAPTIEVPLRPVHRPQPVRRGLRLTPLVAAASVGVGGLIALFLLIEVRPQAQVQPAPGASALTVGALVSPLALPPPAADPADPAAAPAPAPP